MIHGINLDAEISDEEEAQSPRTTTPVQSQPSLLFGDPADYEKMDPVKRETLTQKMMSKWGKWANKNTNPLVKKRRK